MCYGMGCKGANKMKKIEFESEEQLDDFLDDAVHHAFSSLFNEHREFNILNMKNKGYLRKSDLEIAREKYENDLNSTTECESYIFELKKEIERLNNGTK